MALVRSKSTDFFPHKTMSSNTRKLQEALYTHLDDLEKGAFIEALNSYGTHRDIFELVNTLRKILNTPVKRQLFPLVRRVIRHGDVEAFDLLTRGDQLRSNTLPRPFLYRPHIADVNVMNKYRSSSPDKHTTFTAPGGWSRQSHTSHDRNMPVVTFHRSGGSNSGSGASGRDVKHKTLSRRSLNSRDELEGDVFEIDLGEPESEEEGFGFTIRGGLEIGVGVYVSSVDNGSSAQKEGLTAGDLILEANNISFRHISHEEAARIIKAATRLHLKVSRVGRIPGSHFVLEAYRWTDPKGRPVSPPPEGYGSGNGVDDGRRRSGTQMLKGSDERKVNIVVQRGHGLGLMVRGGQEYGLGIFISGIDPFSVAENGGLKVGDQILDVNGRSFLDVTHAEAVSHLKKGRHLIITVKDVGKIPFAKTTIDETGWIESTRVDSYAKSLSMSSRLSLSGSVSDLELKKTTFSRGAGTQLMLSSAMSKSPQRELVQDQAKLLLNDKEHATLNYYLAEYDKKTINVQGLVQALFELLNTAAKLTLLSEIRTAIHPKDLDTFDKLVFNREMEKSLNDARGMLAPDIISIASYDTDDITATEKQRRTMFSHPKSMLRTPQWMDTIQLDEEPQLPAISYNLMEASNRLSRSTPDLSSYDPISMSKLQSRSRARARSKSPKSAFRMISAKGNNLPLSSRMAEDVHVVKAEVHTTKGRIDDPSDDSGVEINGHAMNGASREATLRPTEYTSRYKSTRPKVFPGGNAKGLSGPQQKILTHLQKRSSRDDTANERLNSSKDVDDQDDYYILYRQKSSSLPRPARPSGQIKSDRKGSYNLVEHVAEVHHSGFNPNNSGNDEIADVIATSTQQHMAYSPNADLPSTSGQRSRHASGYKDKLRSRSRSKSRERAAREAFHSIADDYTEASEAKSMNRVGVSGNTKAYEPESYPSTSRGALGILEYSNSHHQLRPRRERSPKKSGGGSSRTNYPIDTSSTSTAVNSSQSQSTLTINGQLMPPRLPQHTNPVIQDTLKASSSQQVSSSLRQHHQQHQHHHHHQQHDHLHPEERSRSRSRTPKPSESPRISRSKSPTPQRREIPSAESLFPSNNHAQPTVTANRRSSQPEREEIKPAHSQEAASKRSKWSRFSSPKKNSSKDTSPNKGGGVSSTKYKSPRRDKPSSKTSVPLIKINSETLPRTGAASRRHSVTERDGNDVTQDPSYLCVNQNNDEYAVPQKSLDSVTISDQLVDIDTALHHSSNDISNDSLPGPPMTIDAIKKKAEEKYGEIPLDVVYIYRSKPTLGVAIEGGANTRQPLPKVINVQPGGSAYESGGLKVGHIILEVNGQPAVGLSHMDAARLIAEAFKNKNSNRMELLVTEWSDRLLDTIKVDVKLLKV